MALYNKIIIQLSFLSVGLSLSQTKNNVDQWKIVKTKTSIVYFKNSTLLCCRLLEESIQFANKCVIHRIKQPSIEIKASKRKTTQHNILYIASTMVQLANHSNI
jgi:hypothetical protein